MKWFNIHHNAATATAAVYVYDEIGLWGVTAKDFADELNALQGINHIDLHVNSPGGSVVEVLAMMQAVKKHPATVTAYIDGLAASSASRLILAADEVEIADNAFLMIHNVWSYAVGNATEMRKEADILDKFDKGLANDYHKKSGKPIEDIEAWMAEDTWFTAEEALASGLVDRIGDEQQAAASVSATFAQRVSSFSNAPQDYQLTTDNKYSLSVSTTDPEPEDEPDTDRIENTDTPTPTPISTPKNQPEPEAELSNFTLGDFERRQNNRERAI